MEKIELYFCIFNEIVHKKVLDSLNTSNLSLRTLIFICSFIIFKNNYIFNFTDAKLENEQLLNFLVEFRPCVTSISETVASNFLKKRNDSSVKLPLRHLRILLSNAIEVYLILRPIPARLCATYFINRHHQKLMILNRAYHPHR